jgi:hypothetical protein
VGCDVSRFELGKMMGSFARDSKRLGLTANFDITSSPTSTAPLTKLFLKELHMSNMDRFSNIPIQQQDAFQTRFNASGI